MLVLTNESKEIIKNIKNCRVKSEISVIEYLKTQLIMMKKNLKNKYDLDDDLSPNITIEIYDVTIVVRAIFMKINIHKFF